MSQPVEEFVREAPGIADAKSHDEGQFVHEYHGRLATGEGPVRILTVAPALSEGVDDAFSRRAAAWETVSSHPNVVTVLDRGSVPRPWVAVQRIGRPLADAQSDCSAADVRTIVSETADAVRSASQSSTVHGSLSPEDVFVVDDEGSVSTRVGDWGIRRSVSTAAGAFEISPYTAPELLESPLSASEKTDVYGLGAVAYDALTGRPPVEGNDLRAAVGNGEIRPPSEYDDAIPDAVDDIVLKALATDPTDRPISTYSFKGTFAAALDPAELTLKSDTGRPDEAGGDANEENDGGADGGRGDEGRNGDSADEDDEIAAEQTGTESPIQRQADETANTGSSRRWVMGLLSVVVVVGALLVMGTAAGIGPLAAGGAVAPTSNATATPPATPTVTPTHTPVSFVVNTSTPTPAAAGFDMATPTPTPTAAGFNTATPTPTDVFRNRTATLTPTPN